MATLCFVIHGIGSQNAEFSTPLRKGIDRQLELLIAEKQVAASNQWKSVQPADLVTYHSLYWADIGTDAQANLYRRIYSNQFSESSLTKRLLSIFTDYSLARDLSINLLGDVFGYLGQFQQPIKQSIVNQIRSVIEPALARQEPVSLVFVGHSLGTVILHDLIGGFLTYGYAHFDRLVGCTSVFTMGSPLALFSLVAERCKPDRFRSWTNFYHKRDPIALPMAKLPEFGKVKDIEIHKMRWSPLALHAMYWENADVHLKIAEEIIAHRVNKIGIAPPHAVARPMSPEIFYPLGGGLTIAGLAESYSDFRKVPFTELIRSAREIDFCNIYGGKWLGTYAPDFEYALQKPDVRIRACITAPDSPALIGLTHHFESKTMGDLVRLINEGTKELENAYKQAKKKSAQPGGLRIFHSKNGINHSFYRFDDLVYFTPRPLASSKNASSPIPCFSFRITKEPGGGYEWIMRDFEELLKNSRDVEVAFDSTTAMLTNGADV